MNPAVSAIYAITLGGTAGPEQDRKLVERIPFLIHEVNRMDELLRDPFIRGYLEARKSWGVTSTSGDAT